MFNSRSDAKGAIMSHKSAQEGPHPLDVAMGINVRLRRKALGMSQGELARTVGITFQQIQKYEHGTNRISFSRLFEISGALKCSLADLIGDLKAKSPSKAFARQTMWLAESGASDLIVAYSRISSLKDRRALLDIARRIVSEQQNEVRALSRKTR